MLGTCTYPKTVAKLLLLFCGQVSAAQQETTACGTRNGAADACRAMSIENFEDLQRTTKETSNSSVYTERYGHSK